MWVILQFLSLGILARANQLAQESIVKHTLATGESLHLSLSSLFPGTDPMASTCTTDNGHLYSYRDNALSRVEYGEGVGGEVVLGKRIGGRVYVLYADGRVRVGEGSEEGNGVKIVGKVEGISVQGKCTDMVEDNGKLYIVCFSQPDSTTRIIQLDIQTNKYLTTTILPQDTNYTIQKIPKFALTNVSTSSSWKIIYLRSLIVYDQGDYNLTTSNNRWLFAFNITEQGLHPLGYLSLAKYPLFTIMHDIFETSQANVMITGRNNTKEIVWTRGLIVYNSTTSSLSFSPLYSPLSIPSPFPSILAYSMHKGYAHVRIDGNGGMEYYIGADEIIEHPNRLTHFRYTSISHYILRDFFITGLDWEDKILLLHTTHQSTFTPTHSLLSPNPHPSLPIPSPSPCPMTPSSILIILAWGCIPPMDILSVEGVELSGSIVYWLMGLLLVQ
jgi:hypothetical protein